MNPPFICSIKSSPPTISAPAFFASSNFSPGKTSYLENSQTGKEIDNYVDKPHKRKLIVVGVPIKDLQILSPT